MRRFMFLSLAVAAVLLMTGCPSKELLDGPEIVKIVMDTSLVTVYWKTDTAITRHPDFSGYNVYAYTDSNALRAEDGEDLNKSNPSAVADTFFPIDNLAPDSIYYIQVRTVNTEDKVGGYDSTRPFVAAALRPEFVKTVYIEWVNGDTTDCALHLSTGEVKKRGDISTVWGDVWIDHDTYGSVDSVWFQSAHKADTTAGYRDTRLQNLGQYALDDVWEMPVPALRVEPIKQGDLVCAKTVEGNYSKIHVDSLYLDTVNNIGWAKITYAYQKIAGFPHLGIRK